MDLQSKAAGVPSHNPTTQKSNNHDSIKDINENKDTQKELQPNKTELLLELVKNEEFFHDDQKQAYVTFLNENHYETWPLESKKFKDWLTFHYWKMYEKSISSPAINDAISVLNGKAIYEGQCHIVYSRVAQLNEEIYINLADEKWQVIEITSNGWSILNKSPVKFSGGANIRPLPLPLHRSGNLDLLWKHVNIQEEDRVLIVAWLLDTLMPNTPYPILMITGGHGTGKSKTQERLRELIDPSTSNLRNPPKKSDDIPTAAQNNYLVSYNNVSKLNTENQDDLCCLATGGGFGKRSLYTNGDESVVNIKRPIIMNSICDVITRPDLMDRVVKINLPTINASSRQSESDMDKSFNEDLPEIYIGLLNLLTKVLAIMPTIELKEKPRMANFAIVGEATIKALGIKNIKFIDLHNLNYNENMLNALDGSAVGLAVISLINEEGFFEGSYAELYEKLYWHRIGRAYLPDSPKGLANELKRLASILNLAKLEVIFSDKRRNSGFHVTIKPKDS